MGLSQLWIIIVVLIHFEHNILLQLYSAAAKMYWLSFENLVMTSNPRETIEFIHRSIVLILRKRLKSPWLITWGRALILTTPIFLLTEQGSKFYFCAL